MIKLDVGCGNYKKDGYIGIDISDFPCVNIVRDIQKGLPFSDNTIDEIYCNHCLEHIDELIFVMNEFCRVLKKESLLYVNVPLAYAPVNLPSGDIINMIGSGAFRDPTHKRFFTPETFFYWTKGYMENAEYGINSFFEIKDQNIIKEIRNSHCMGFNLKITLKVLK